MSSEKPVWFVAEYLLTISHYRLISASRPRGCIGSTVGCSRLSVWSGL